MALKKSKSLTKEWGALSSPLGTRHIFQSGHVFKFHEFPSGLLLGGFQVGDTCGVVLVVEEDDDGS